ncbi:MAG: AAA family ATPase [Bacteroidales bacterium]|nr:AAA family ATPase [Bacteroidales bacterium]
MTPTTSQKHILNQITDFLFSEEGDIFILKGYAGTGKTTMIRFVVDTLISKSVQYQLMAPTGRAAKVLRDKVGESYTIHKTIYNYIDLQCLQTDAKDDSEKSFRYVFPIRMKAMNNQIPTVAIVDESSMISDTETHQEFCTFGTGRLLSDLLQYTKNVGINKIIFVGDDAQLPPVSDNHSCALDASYFDSLGYSVMCVEMTDVIRQSGESGILETATTIRGLLRRSRKERTSFSIDSNGNDLIELPYDDEYDKYFELNPTRKIGGCVIINYTNQQCYRSNSIIRERMYGENCDVRTGDILLINNNNYHTFNREIYNGDMAEVVGVGGIETARISVKRGAERKDITLEFKKLTLQFPDDESPTQCMVYYPLLFNGDADITAWEQQALYINFKIRHPKLKEGSEEYKEALRHDLYFNVLKAKFGYSITCHKAQGGEWDCIIVDYSMRTGTSDDMLRWCYTATTRAKKQLYLLNPPQITPLSKFKYVPITKISRCPSDFFSGMVVESTFHKDGMTEVPAAVKFKCLSIVETLKDTPYTLIGVESMNWRERLSIMYQDEVLKVDLTYGASGLCNPLPINGDATVERLHRIINEANNAPNYIIYYNPSSSSCRSLYNRILSLCKEFDIRIVNIIEDLSHYKVSYNIVTSARFAKIDFYINDKGFVSTAVPLSELGDDDTKLKQLLDNIA